MERVTADFDVYVFFLSLQPTGRATLRAPAPAAPRVPNLSRLLRRTPTARNTVGKRARASRSQMVYQQATKVPRQSF